MGVLLLPTLPAAKNPKQAQRYAVGDKGNFSVFELAQALAFAALAEPAPTLRVGRGSQHQEQRGQTK